MQKKLPPLPLDICDTFSLPNWLKSKIVDSTGDWLSRQWSEEESIQLAVDLSRWNVEHKTGGPFGAAIICQDTFRLVSVGVNRVIETHDPTAHAEMVAIRLAAERLGDFCLKDCILYTSAQPCCMCFGGVLWSGIRRVYFALPTEKVEQIGFEEGPAPTQEELTKAGIGYVHYPGVEEHLEQSAQSVLKAYCDHGGLIYNGAG